MKKGFKIVMSMALAAAISLSSFSAYAAPKRDEAAEKYKWDLTDIYETRSDFDKDIKDLKENYIPKLASYKGKLNNADDILAYLKLDDEASIALTRVYVYSGLYRDLDQGNSDATEMNQIANGVYEEYLGATSYAKPELLYMDEVKFKEVMNDAKLEVYKHYLDTMLKEKEHTLSQEEERILALAQGLTGTPEDIFQKVTLADYKKAKIINKEGEEVELTGSVYSKILEDNDREYRKKAYMANAEAKKAINNTAAATLAAEVKKNIFLAKSRGYDSALEASLAAEHIPRDIYDSLVNSVNQNLAPLHKYYKVRKEAMGLDELYGYDCWVPLVNDYNMEIPFDEGVELIMEGLKPLGEEYLKEFKNGIDNQWVDAYEDDRKYTGAYNWGTYDAHPYVLMNYNDSLDSTLTLAHEMGHAINKLYSNREQEYVNSSYPIFTAEVASTANELLVMDHLIKNAKTDDEKLFLLNKQIDNIKGTIYTQVMFAEFEQAIHEKVEKGEPLSAGVLNDTWLNILKKYYGADYTVGEEAKYGWSKISHFYMNFYVYKYATSMSAANEVVNNIIEGKEGAVENYLEFLAAGGSDYPVEMLQEAGVDMTTSAPVDNILKYFGELVDEMEEVLSHKQVVKTKNYTVKDGDKLWKIAHDFKTTVNEIAKLNNMSNPNMIFAGATIKVPAK